MTVPTGITVDTESVRAYLAETDKELEVYIDETHMSYLPVYLARAHARHALGEAPDAVLRELWMAARCYAAHGKILLAKWPRYQFRRRRLVPFEAALVTGDPDVLKAVQGVFGMDPMIILAGQEPEEVTHEVRVLTGFFRGARVEDGPDLAGLLAVLYWLAMSSVIDANINGLEMVRALAAKVLESNSWLASKGGDGMGRMLAIHQVVGELRPPSPDAIVGGLRDHGRLHRKALAARAAEDEAVTKRGDGMLDLTTLSLMSLVAAAGIDLGPALDAARSEADLAEPLAYAKALGHTASP